MRMLFKQRLFSWFDSYDIYDESGAVLFTVEGKLSWGHCLHILDAAGQHIGTVQERVLTFLPQFELYAYGDYLSRFPDWRFSLFNNLIGQHLPSAVLSRYHLGAHGLIPEDIQLPFIVVLPQVRGVVQAHHAFLVPFGPVEGVIRHHCVSVDHIIRIVVLQIGQ